MYLSILNQGLLPLNPPVSTHFWFLPGQILHCTVTLKLSIHSFIIPIFFFSRGQGHGGQQSTNTDTNSAHLPFASVSIAQLN